MTDSSPPWFGEYRVLGIPETLTPYPEEPVHSLLYQAARDIPTQPHARPIDTSCSATRYPTAARHSDGLRAFLR